MKKLLFIIAASALLISGCTKSTEGPGKLVVKVTDDPFNISFVESPTVRITKVELRKADTDSFMVVSDDTLTVDLLQLRNGLTEELVNIEIPQGNYDLVRIYVDEASLKLKDHADAYTLKVPSGKQSGIKVFIAPSLNVSGGLTSELLLDFDLARSFVMRGNMAHAAGVNGFIFKPVIKAMNISTAGRIEGLVTDTVNVSMENAKVCLLHDADTAATSFTDATGHYAFIGVPAGTYSVGATKELYDTVRYDNVNVVEANRTIQDFILRILKK